MKTKDKILIVSEEPVSDRITNGLHLNGYDCVFSSIKSCLDIISKYSPDMALLLNLKEKEAGLITKIKEHSDTPIVSSTEILTPTGESIVSFAGVEKIRSTQSEALIVNKVRIYLRLKKIQQLAEDLTKI